jgi:hypothetical protein
MPVEATVKNRSQAARRPDVRIAREHVRDLVRVLAVNAGERERGEAAGRSLIHLRVDSLRRSVPCRQECQYEGRSLCAHGF